MASMRRRRWRSGGVNKEAWIVDYFDIDGRRHIKTFEGQRDAESFIRNGISPRINEGRTAYRLTPQIAHMNIPAGTYNDGGGLYLVVCPSGDKHWIFRLPNKRGQKIGEARSIPLEEARQKATHLRHLSILRRNLVRPSLCREGDETLPPSVRKKRIRERLRYEEMRHDPDYLDRRREASSRRATKVRAAINVLKELGVKI